MTLFCHYIEGFMKDDYLAKIKNMILRFKFEIVVFFSTVIVYNGYLNPSQKRVFGDLSPTERFSNLDIGFQFYGVQFLENFASLNNAPYRILFDILKFYSEKIFLFDKFQVDWIAIFLPFLISCFLSSYFFKYLSTNNYLSFLGWGFYTFSTFTLFTSSIHTEIIVSINLTLYLIYLYLKWLYGEKSILINLYYSLFSSLVLYFALAFDMRLFVLNFPYYFIILVVFTINYLKKEKVKLKELFVPYLQYFTPVFIFSTFNFLFLIFGIGKISSTVGEIVNRGTWGNFYFRLINALSISHPFWNNQEPINFIYNYPFFVYHLNILLFLIIISLVIIYKRSLGVFFLLLVPFLFLVFLSKQNNDPISNFYEVIYQLPYFNLAREASKYYYIMVIIWSIFLVKLLSIESINKYFKWFMVLISVLPLVSNILVFSTGKYGKSTVEYAKDTQIHGKINQYISQDSNNNFEKRTLWIPYISAIQDNTDEVRNISYSQLIDSYPLLNIDKDSESYIFNSLKSENVKKYIELFGIEYIILPNLENEPSIKEIVDVDYPNFNFREIRQIINENFAVSMTKDIDGYKIIKLNWGSREIYYNDYLNINNKTPSYKYTNIGDIKLKDNKSEIQSFSTLSLTPPLISNCNNNPARGLGFMPSDRINFSYDNADYNFEILAKYQEVPCIIFELSDQDIDFKNEIYLDFKKFEGDDIDMYFFRRDKEKKLFQTASYTLREDNDLNYIPFTCEDGNCVIFFYLRGDRVNRDNYTSFSFNLITDVVAKDNFSDRDFLIYQKPITNLNNTVIKKEDFIPNNSYSESNKYMLFRYKYEKNVGLVLKDNEKLNPVENNHNLLIFNIENKDLTDARLVYQDEVEIKQSLNIAMISLSINFIVFIILSIIIYKKHMLNN